MHLLAYISTFLYIIKKAQNSSSSTYLANIQLESRGFEEAPEKIPGVTLAFNTNLQLIIVTVITAEQNDDQKTLPVNGKRKISFKAKNHIFFTFKRKKTTLDEKIDLKGYKIPITQPPSHSDMSEIYIGDIVFYESLETNAADYSWIGDNVNSSKGKLTFTFEIGKKRKPIYPFLHLSTKKPKISHFFCPVIENSSVLIKVSFNGNAGLSHENVQEKAHIGLEALSFTFELYQDDLTKEYAHLSADTNKTINNQRGLIKIDETALKDFEILVAEVESRIFSNEHQSLYSLESVIGQTSMILSKGVVNSLRLGMALESKKTEVGEERKKLAANTGNPALNTDTDGQKALNEENAKLDEEIKQQNTEIAKLRKNIEELRSDKATGESEVGLLQYRLKTDNNEMTELNAQIDALKKEKDKLEQGNPVLDGIKKVKEMEEKNKKAEEELKELREKIKSIESEKKNIIVVSGGVLSILVAVGAGVGYLYVHFRRNARKYQVRSHSSKGKVR